MLRHSTQYLNSAQFDYSKFALLQRRKLESTENASQLLAFWSKKILFVADFVNLLSITDYVIFQFVTF